MSVPSSTGFEVFGLPGVVFVALKLAGVITWPWIWVTAPFWGGLVVTALFLLATLIVLVVSDR